MSDEFDPPSWTDSSGVWHSGTRKAYAERMRGSTPSPAYPWHYDDNGYFHWGTPAQRGQRLSEERSRPDRIAAEEDHRKQISLEESLRQSAAARAKLDREKGRGR